ncbi:hypothetical protein [Marinibacterium sp. SX1]|uniref:hypothetical protein n=1 Tax=Marinibacterium sp. SX1 TaxID=3388424 RepID=UPI003D173BE3
MTDPVTNVEIEDVLSSIRRLVSEESRKPLVAGSAKAPESQDDSTARTDKAGGLAETGTRDKLQDRLVLTPALRVTDPVTPPAEAETPIAAETSFEAETPDEGAAEAPADPLARDTAGEDAPFAGDDEVTAGDDEPTTDEETVNRPNPAMSYDLSMQERMADTPEAPEAPEALPLRAYELTPRERMPERETRDDADTVRDSAPIVLHPAPLRLDAAEAPAPQRPEAASDAVDTAPEVADADRARAEELNVEELIAEEFPADGAAADTAVSDDVPTEDLSIDEALAGEMLVDDGLAGVPPGDEAQADAPPADGDLTDNDLTDEAAADAAMASAERLAAEEEELDRYCRLAGDDEPDEDDWAGSGLPSPTGDVAQPTDAATAEVLGPQEPRHVTPSRVTREERGPAPSQLYTPFAASVARPDPTAETADSGAGAEPMVLRPDLPDPSAELVSDAALANAPDMSADDLPDAEPGAESWTPAEARAFVVAASSEASATTDTEADVPTAGAPAMQGAPLAPDETDALLASAADAIDALQAKIAALEAQLAAGQPAPMPAAVDDTEDEPELPESNVTQGHWQPRADEVSDEEAAAEAADALREAQAANADIFGTEEAVLDEDSLRELVIDMVREELQGALGERITRNVRKLVRREIHRALAAQDLD